MDNTSSPSPGAAAPPHGDGGSAFFDSVRRSGLARSQDRWIGGVAGGVASRLGIDPLIVRGIFVVLGLFGGLVIVAYGVAWALLPEAADGRIHLQEAFRGRFDAALAGAAAFVAVGIARPVAWFEAERWVPGWVIGLAWLGLLVTVIVLAVTAAGRASRPGPPGEPPWPAGYAHSSGSSRSAPYPASAAPSPSAAGTSPTPTTAIGPTTMSSSGPGPAPAPYPAYGPMYAPPADGPVPPAHRAGPTPAPGWQPPPPRPTVPGPGSTTVAVALALVLFAGAAVLLAQRAGAGIERPGLAFGGAALLILGIASLVSGLRGRRAGTLAGIGVLVAVLAVPAAIATSLGPEGRRGPADGGVVAGDVVWSPSTVAEAERGFSYAVGEARVDLTAPAWAASAPAEVAVEAGVGSTTVVLPADVPLEVRAHVGAGEIRSLVSADWQRPTAATLRRGDSNPPDGESGRVRRTEAEGTDVEAVLRSPAAAEDPDGDLALVVTIEAGLGDVTIEEENR